METSWRLALWETRRDHWCGCTLMCRRSSRNEGVTHGRWGLERWDMVGVPEDSPGEDLVKVQPSCNRDTRIWEMTGPWEDHWGQQQLWSGAGLGLGGRLDREWQSSRPAQKIVSASPMEDTELHDWIYTVGCRLCLIKTVAVPWFFLLGIKSM